MKVEFISMEYKYRLNKKTPAKVEFIKEKAMYCVWVKIGEWITKYYSSSEPSKKLANVYLNRAIDKYIAK